MAKANTTCSIDGCERKKASKGMCDSHYRRWRDTGTPHKTCRSCGIEMPGVMGRGNFYCSDECKTCKVEGCAKATHAKGMCHMHDQRVRTHGTPYRRCETCNDEMAEDFGLAKYCGPGCRPRCKVEGCEEPYRSKDGYCARHKALVRRHGKPVGRHEWAPKSDEYTCVVCGTVFTETEGRRKHCSSNCQVLDSTYQGHVPSLDFDCVMCGKHFKRNRKDALYQRGDKKLCDRCRVSKSRRHKSSPGYLAKRDGGDCGICGKRVDLELRHPDPNSGSVDHIIPVALGGTHDEENLQLSHLTCNLKKQARMDYQPA